MTITLVSLFPIAVFAQTPSAQELVKQMQALLTQYSERIRVLEAENTMLKALIAKHEIQIPLDEYNKILNTTPAPNVNVTANNTATASGATSTGELLLAQPSQSMAISVSLTPLQKGFIDQINKDWIGIRGAYQFPENAWIGGYEFVKNPAMNSVFVDIVYGGGTPEGAYNAKLLYEFDKTTFKRKLIGLFIYNSETKGYVTKTGTNPFAGVERDMIRGTMATPSTPTLNSAPQNPSTPVVTNTDSSAEIENKLTTMYQAKNYAGVISTSDAFLKNSAPTYKILQLRYRSYFVLREFSKALAEVQKMEAAGLATQFSYCEAYVIALHANNNALVQKYKKLAGAGCSTTGS